MSDTASGVNDQKVIGDEQAPVNRAEAEKRQAVSDFDRNDSSLHVHIHSPFRDYYEGPAFSLSAENATGPFDILPHHHNFISLLVPCEIIIRTVDDGEKRIRISGGIIHVKADRIVVFLDV